ncbi:MAG: porin family protein [bacterium]|nr:porin family protein [bacterium]
MKNRSIIIAALLVIVSAVGYAQEFELTPLIGYQTGGHLQNRYSANPKDIDIDNSMSFGIAFDIGFAPEQMIEFLWLRQDTSVENTDRQTQDDVSLDYLQIGYLYHFQPFETVDPFVVFSIGTTRFDIADAGSTWRFSGTIGGGVKFNLSERVGIRLDGRFYGSYIGSHYNDNGWCDPWGCYGWSDSTSLLQFGATAGLIIKLGD